MQDWMPTNCKLNYPQIWYYGILEEGQWFPFPNLHGVSVSDNSMKNKITGECGRDCQIFDSSLFYTEFSLNTTIPIIPTVWTRGKKTHQALPDFSFWSTLFSFLVFFFFLVYQIGRKLSESKVYAAVHTAENHFCGMEWQRTIKYLVFLSYHTHYLTTLLWFYNCVGCRNGHCGFCYDKNHPSFSSLAPYEKGSIFQW